MADLSKIKLNGTTYNFKDAIARESLTVIQDSLGGGSGGDSSDFIIHVTQTIIEEAPVQNVDVTWSELVDAYKAGKNLILRVEGEDYQGNMQYAWYRFGSLGLYSSGELKRFEFYKTDYVCSDISYQVTSMNVARIKLTRDPSAHNGILVTSGDYSASLAQTPND